MIISYLQGGLCNQLFQIAASIGAGEFYGREWRVQGNFQYRQYLNIPEERYIDSYALPRYTEPHFHYSLIPDGNWELFGYFQSQKYWKASEGLVKAMFSWKEVPANWNTENVKDRCAIHIRGTDYKQLSDYHFNLQKDYYEKAIELSGFSLLNKFTIFTDDVEHAKELLPDIPIISGRRENDKETVENLFDMSQYDCLIMANSSYSWWAAVLGKEKKVIAPKSWFGEKKRHYNTSDLYLPEWTVI